MPENKTSSRQVNTLSKDNGKTGSEMIISFYQKSVEINKY